MFSDMSDQEERLVNQQQQHDSKKPKEEKRVVEENDFPEYFGCGISYELMVNPVIAEDGRIYDYKNILGWFNKCEELLKPITSPINTNQIGKTLVPDYGLRREIRPYLLKISIQSNSSSSSSSGPSYQEVKHDSRVKKTIITHTRILEG